MTDKSWWKRSLAGMVGGAAGTAAMTLYMKKAGSQLQPEAEHDISLIGRKHAEGESATAALGRIVYEKVTGNEPDLATKQKLANIVHWAYGVDMGAAYGLVRGRAGTVDLLGGLAYGAALWVLGDEMAVPLLGLAQGPKAVPAAIHAETFTAHLVYGVTTAAATQLMERVV